MNIQKNIFYYLQEENNPDSLMQSEYKPDNKKYVIIDIRQYPNTTNVLFYLYVYNEQDKLIYTKDIVLDKVLYQNYKQVFKIITQQILKLLKSQNIKENDKIKTRSKAAPKKVYNF